MSFDLVAIRKGIAANADTAAEVANTKHYRPTTEFGGIGFWVEPETVERSAHNDRWHIVLIGTLLMQSGWDRSKQEKGDRVLEDTWTAIEVDPTLGGAALVTWVESARYIRDLEPGVGIEYVIHVEA